MFSTCGGIHVLKRVKTVCANVLLWNPPQLILPDRNFDARCAARNIRTVARRGPDVDKVTEATKYGKIMLALHGRWTSPDVAPAPGKTRGFAP
jgi:hypothetical protein